MVILTGTKTEKNLTDAFIGESQARNKYSYFAAKAKEEGKESVESTFEELAVNEREHAKLWYKVLIGGDIPASADNIKMAIAGEHGEWTLMYKRMAEEAREEGFNGIAYLFDSVAAIEKEHEERLTALLSELEGGPGQPSKEKSVWMCGNCGHIIDGAAPPDECPVCKASKESFAQREIRF